jgi:gamma-glutamyl phosphate reductase
MLKVKKPSFPNEALCRKLKNINIKTYMETVGVAALESSRVIARATTETKNKALASIAARLNDERQNLLSANRIDMAKGLANVLDTALNLTMSVLMP